MKHYLVQRTISRMPFFRHFAEDSGRISQFITRYGQNSRNLNEPKVTKIIHNQSHD